MIFVRNSLPKRILAFTMMIFFLFFSIFIIPVKAELLTLSAGAVLVGLTLLVGTGIAIALSDADAQTFFSGLWSKMSNDLQTKLNLAGALLSAGQSTVVNAGSQLWSDFSSFVGSHFSDNIYNDHMDISGFFSPHVTLNPSTDSSSVVGEVSSGSSTFVQENDQFKYMVERIGPTTVYYTVISKINGTRLFLASSGDVNYNSRYIFSPYFSYVNGQGSFDFYSRYSNSQGYANPFSFAGYKVINPVVDGVNVLPEVAYSLSVNYGQGCYQLIPPNQTDPTLLLAYASTLTPQQVAFNLLSGSAVIKQVNVNSTYFPTTKNPTATGENEWVDAGAPVVVYPTVSQVLAQNPADVVDVTNAIPEEPPLPTELTDFIPLFFEKADNLFNSVGNFIFQLQSIYDWIPYTTRVFVLSALGISVVAILIRFVRG